MDRRCAIVSILVLCSLLNAAKEIRTTCSSKYTQFTVNHTMCLKDNPYAQVVPITDAAKTSVVDLHNSYRSSVAEPAANMQKMYYNEDLAKGAEKWAMQCIWNHDSYDQRKLADYPGSVGQNMWASSGKVDAVGFTYATESWYSEIKDFVFGTWSKATGHYLQQVHAISSLVGCGASHCYDADGKFQTTTVVCNYHIGAGGTLYKKGASCSDCPDHCSGGKLCDCKGTVCMNGGKLNVGTCSCDCPTGYGGKTCSEVLCRGVKCKSEGSLNYDDCSCKCLPGYTGKRCEKCPGPTSWDSWCRKGGQCDKNWSKKWLYGNCPNCSPDCQGTVCQGKVCQNGGKLNERTCSCDCPAGFSGITCSEEAACRGKECKNLGTLDTKSCTCSCLEGYSGDKCEKCAGPTSWIGWCKKPGQCDKSWSKTWLYKNCPNCSPDCQGAAAACRGKECKNLGTLDTSSCTCSCLEGYSGDKCETCPGPILIWKNWCNQPGQCAKKWSKTWLYKNCPNCNPDCKA